MAVEPSQLSQIWFGHPRLGRQSVPGVYELTAQSMTPPPQGHGDFVVDAQCSTLKPPPQMDFHLNIASLTDVSLFFELFLHSQSSEEPRLEQPAAISSPTARLLLQPNLLAWIGSCNPRGTHFNINCKHVDADHVYS